MITKVKIKSIRKIKCNKVKVYDITVPKTKNFCLANGLIVHNCLPYAYLKSTIYDRRLTVYGKCDFLTEEVLGLERESDGHINHPENGTQGSKDAIDAICGALWNASQHADEFAYDYGESAINIADINEKENFMLEDYNAQYEENIKNQKYKKSPTADEQYMDFGMGRSRSIEELSDISGGILSW